MKDCISAYQRFDYFIAVQIVYFDCNVEIVVAVIVIVYGLTFS